MRSQRTTLFVLFLWLPAFLLHAGGPGNKAPVVERMLELYHGSPRPLDEKLCKDVLNDYLNYLDGSHMYFTAGDIGKIKQTVNVMGGIKNTDPDFLNTIVALYRQRLLWADTLVTDLLQKPFDFTLNETFTLGNDSTPYASDDKELKERWRKLLKYETLHRITDLFLYDSTVTKKEMLNQQRGQEKIVLKSEERRIKKVLNNPAGYENYMINLFCNTLAQAYDPHSEFFPVTEKENFENELNGDGYTFGIEIDDNDKGEVEITHLTPGSPAWNCGSLSQGDVFVQMQWDGEPPIDLAGADWAEVGELLDADNHRQLNLTVHKANGMNVTVGLHKAKAQSEEDYLKRYVLAGDYKIGYILLPGFYSEFENIPGSNCANDVAREVIKLKKENIKGLILDLRNNGGGSMEEAIALAGIFIDEGTLGFVRERTGRPHAVKDPNRGSIYDGPLLVMVNGESASASEFVAGALQDYNRAIIVGAPTFGKATAQAVVPCDTTFNLEKSTPESLNNSKSDFVKITLDRLYRVTGKSNQLNGVQPDIFLPDELGAMDERESSLKHALMPDSVKRAIYFNQLPPMPISQLSVKSMARVNASHSFAVTKQAIDILREMRKIKESPLPLAFDPFFDLTKKYGSGTVALYREIENDSIRTFKAESFGDDKARIALGGYEAETSNRILSSLMHDIYINESFLILADYIQLNK